MSALAIVAICLGGTFAYCFMAAWLYMRLLWHLKRGKSYDPEIGAFFWAALVPVGIAILAVYTLAPSDAHKGIAPRSVRRAEAREREIKEQREEIARLERELNIR